MLAGPVAPGLIHGQCLSRGPAIYGSRRTGDVGRWSTIDTLLGPLTAGTVIARILAVTLKVRQRRLLQGSILPTFFLCV